MCIRDSDASKFVFVSESDDAGSGDGDSEIEYIDEYTLTDFSVQSENGVFANLLLSDGDLDALKFNRKICTSLNSTLLRFISDASGIGAVRDMLQSCTAVACVPSGNYADEMSPMVASAFNPDSTRPALVNWAADLDLATLTLNFDLSLIHI